MLLLAYLFSRTQVRCTHVSRFVCLKRNDGNLNISLGSQAVPKNSVSPSVTIVSFRGFAAVTFASLASCAGMLPAILITRPPPLQCCPSPASSRMFLLHFAVSRHQSLNRNVCACLTFLSHSGAVHTCVQICVS